jgi:hypothetical protein
VGPTSILVVRYLAGKTPVPHRLAAASLSRGGVGKPVLRLRASHWHDRRLRRGWKWADLSHFDMSGLANYRALSLCKQILTLIV